MARQELAQLVGLALVTEQDEHALPGLQPALRLVLEQIHLPLERRHVDGGETDGRLWLRAVHRLQHERRVDDTIAISRRQQCLPGKDFTLQVRRLLECRADGLTDAQRLIENDRTAPT